VKEEFDVFSDLGISRRLMSRCMIRLFAFGGETLFPVEKRPWHTLQDVFIRNTKTELSGEGNRSLCRSMILNLSLLTFQLPFCKKKAVAPPESKQVYFLRTM
jgi:hypothetical protein